MVSKRNQVLLYRSFARQRAPRWLFRLGGMIGVLALLALTLAACTNDTPPAPSTNGTPIAQLHWCTKPVAVFQDASQSPATMLTDWAQVKTALDFTTYLPKTLPPGSCLVSGEATVHDKVLGSSFGVSYLLPGNVSLAISETAVSGAQAPTFACSPSSGSGASGTPTPTAGTPTPGAGDQTSTLLCLGAKDKTNVVIDSSESEKDLQTLFNSLQPNVTWLPPSAQVAPSPTPSATPAPSPTAQG